MNTPCPVCGGDGPKYDTKSDWCLACVNGELTIQDIEAHDYVERHEVIST